MKTFECVVRNCNSGKQIVVLVRAIDAGSAKREAAEQARSQFGSSSVSVESAREV